MIDAHCHIYKPMYTDSEIAQIIQFAKNAGVEAMINNGGGLESSKKAITISHLYPEIYATVGAHPEEGFEVNADDFKELIDDKVVAIGECGLDYTQNTTEDEKIKQWELFKFNVQLAKDTALPLVIHCRNAFKDVFSLVDYGQVQMHCFTGNMEQMQECVRRGWYISFGGIITFKKSDYLRQVVKDVPADRLLIETDSPYLSPEPTRGDRNQPANVKIIAALIAELRSVSLQELDALTTANTKTLFAKIP